MTRPTSPEWLMSIAHVVAQRATCSRRQVGAVLVRDGRILGQGYNGAPPGEPHCIDVGCAMEAGHCIRSLHAEENLIAHCARYGIETKGAEVYVTVKPCYRCDRLMRSAGIESFVYRDEYRSDDSQRRKLERNMASLHLDWQALWGQAYEVDFKK